MESSPSSSRFVRQFALTQGRVRSQGAELALDTLVRRTPRGGAAMTKMRGEQLAIIELTETTMSVAEISAHLHLHLGISRVLVSDLAAKGFVEVSTTEVADGGPDLPTLERLLDDLQSL